jgi:hypothetical protein
MVDHVAPPASPEVEWRGITQCSLVIAGLYLAVPTSYKESGTSLVFEGQRVESNYPVAKL